MPAPRHPCRTSAEVTLRSLGVRCLCPGVRPRQDVDQGRVRHLILRRRRIRVRQKHGAGSKTFVDSFPFLNHPIAGYGRHAGLSHQPINAKSWRCHVLEDARGALVMKHAAPVAPAAHSICLQPDCRGIGPKAVFRLRPELSVVAPKLRDIHFHALSGRARRIRSGHVRRIIRTPPVHRVLAPAQRLHLLLGCAYRARCGGTGAAAPT